MRYEGLQGSPVTRLHRVTLILCIQWILSTLHTCPQSTPASYQLSKCGANVAVISKEFPGLPIVRMLEAWVVLQWHTETDGVGFAALHCSVQLSACCVHAACSQLWSALQLLVYVPTSCRLQRCRIWSAALQSACSTDCSTEAWWAGLGWAGLVINLQLGRGGDRES